MELYPNDLGKNRYLVLLRRRAWASMHNANVRTGVSPAMGTSVTLATDEISPSRHPLVSFWTKDLRVRDDETRARVATIAQGGDSGGGLMLASIFSGIYLVIVPSIFAALFSHAELALLLPAIWGAGMYGMWRYAPRHWLRKMEQLPLSAPEVESLLPTARGNLERQFLSLALDIQRIKIPEGAARTEIQASLAALGEAISVLPGEPPSHGVTAAVYKNTLLQVAHLRDAVWTFDSGLSAAVGAGAVGVASASLDRLGVEAASQAMAHRELEEELGMPLSDLFSAGVAPNPAPLPSVPETLVPTPNISSEPARQTVGVSAPGGGAKWWQGRAG